MKLIVICIIGLACISTWAGQTSIVARSHPLYKVEQKARAEKIDYNDYKKYKVLPSDSLAQTYRKLIILNHCRFKRVMNNKTWDSKFMPLLRFDP